MGFSIAKTTTVCYHCGNEAVEGEHIYDDLNFCCLGCQSVYTILSSNNLCGYYQLEQNPGVKKSTTSNLNYLDEPEIVSQLLDYKNDTYSRIRFYIPAIHCSSCIWLLEHLYKIDENIYNSRIDFLKKEVTIYFKHNYISLKKVVEHLINIGYEPLISLQDVVKEKSTVDKSLVKKIAVAGFCMGNVMLFSFPEYFGLSSFDEAFKSLFGWLNLLFCLPIVFYCAQDYFKSSYIHLKQKRINLDMPLTLIIIVLFLRTGYEVISGTGPGFADTLTGLLFLLLIGKWVKQRTYYHLSFNRDYRSYFPLAVTVLNDGVEKPVQLSALNVGDRILVRNGELIPADSILMKGEGWLDMSFVTGESSPEKKLLGEMIYAGGRQTGEAIELTIVKPVSQSYLTSLWNSETSKKDELNNFNDRIAKYFVVAVFVIAFLSTLYWVVQGDNYKAWSAFTAVIIVACPCVLTLSTPFTLSAILSVFDKKGFYVKSTDTVEHLAGISHIVFDKTGTLSDTASTQVVFEGKRSLAINNYLASVLRNSAHPQSQSILNYLGPAELKDVSSFKEIPGAGIEGIVDGNLIRIGSASFIGVSHLNDLKPGVHTSINEQYLGVFSTTQSWRTGLSELFGQLKKYTLHLLSGDSVKSKDAINKILKNRLIMNFEQNPHQKQEYINKLENKDNRVLMLGDGLNDAGALKRASVGVAVTDNVNSFSPGCDAILQGDSIKYLPQFLNLSKRGMSIVKFCFLIAASYNVVGLYFAVQGTLYPLIAAVLMPISTLTIISYTTIATRIAARKNKLI